MVPPRVGATQRVDPVAGGIQVAGLLVLAAGLCLLAPWLGVAVLGAGALAMGVALELRP